MTSSGSSAGHPVPVGADDQPPAGPPPPVGTPPPPRPSGTGWTGGRVVSVVLGSLLVVGASGLASGGVGLLAVDQVARDADGFVMSPRDRLATDGFAITSEDAHLHTDGTLEMLPDAVVGDLRLSVEGADGTEVFVGIAPAAEVRSYLAGVRHDTLLEVRGGDPVYRATPGGAPATPPTEQTFWAAEASGTEPELTWSLEEGDWTAVVMAADGSGGVAADVSAGAEIPVLRTVVTVLFVLAVLLVLLGAALIAVPVRSVSREKP